MGNLLTSAVSAADVIMPVPQQQISKPVHHGMDKLQGEPPPECPMHKATEKAPPKRISECPVDHMSAEEINPLNMVCINDTTFLLYNEVNFYTEY